MINNTEEMPTSVRLMGLDDFLSHLFAVLTVYELLFIAFSFITDLQSLLY